MNVALPPELEQYVKDKVAGGRYACAEDLLEDAILLHMQLDELERRKFERLKRDIAVAEEQVKRGEYVDGEMVFARLEERMRRNEGARESA